MTITTESPDRRSLLFTCGTLYLAVSLMTVPAARAQQGDSPPVLPLPTTDAAATTVTYNADYFRQWNPVSAADMINRIPGISIALGDGSANANNRGLGSSESILINGRRLTGKDNDASDQLRRIAFAQVSRIDIIRGTSSSLVGIRNEGQIVNIITESDDQTSVTLEASANHFQDGHVEPGGALSLSGNRAALDYRLSLENEPAYEVFETRESSIHGQDFSPNDERREHRITDQVNRVVNSNLTYRFLSGDIFTMNLLYENTNPPGWVSRRITDFNTQPPTDRNEEEDIRSSRDNWEIGADYNHTFRDSSELQLLFIQNREDQTTLRQRYRVQPENEPLQDLRLGNDVANRERIFRTVYTRALAPSHDLELGAERALTRLDTALQLAQLRSSGGSAPPELTDIDLPDADSRIEEIRYEGFVVHHWRLNSKMTLETTLLYETSEITQTGDVHKVRDFHFFRPELDYRFNITPSLQLRLSAEKFVEQLRFTDFAATTDPRDEDRDTIAGNPELRQQRSWRYALNLEYRFLEERGLINGRVFHRDVQDVIGKVDATIPGEPVQSVNGNIGDGTVSGLELNSSFRLTPDLLLSGSVLVRDSEVIDPFTGQPRRIPPNDRGHYTLGLRHDITALNVNYGFNFRGASQGNRPMYDINRIDDIEQREDLSLFAEKTSLSRFDLSLRFDARNLLDNAVCTDRLRFDGHLSRGVIEEIEYRCDRRGRQYSVELRGTF